MLSLTSASNDSGCLSGSINDIEHGCLFKQSAGMWKGPVLHMGDMGISCSLTSVGEWKRSVQWPNCGWRSWLRASKSKLVDGSMLMAVRHEIGQYLVILVWFKDNYNYVQVRDHYFWFVPVLPVFNKFNEDWPTSLTTYRCLKGKLHLDKQRMSVAPGAARNFAW